MLPSQPRPAPARRNLHPADELAELRQEIRRLKAREDELRRIMLEDPAAREGHSCRIDVRLQQRRVFLRDRLPPDILARADLWQQRVSPLVRVLDAAAPRSHTKRQPTPDAAHSRPKASASCPPRDAQDEFDVIEPF